MSILKNLQSRIESGAGDNSVKAQLATVIGGMISNTSMAVRSTKSLVGPLKGATLTTFLEVLHLGEIIRYEKDLFLLVHRADFSAWLIFAGETW